MGRLTLITGGARAGKTTFAHSFARGHGDHVTYIATAAPGDEEMAARIAAHRAERPPAWRTVETPLRPSRALEQVPTGHLVILDCLTLLTSNLLLSALPDPEFDTVAAARALGSVEEEVAALADAQARRDGLLIVVTNEVGLGIVPASALTRLYRDALGRANQRLAARADAVYLVVSGLALELRAAGALPIIPGE
jgi:adenosylcobinamide kinase / adenosylcobinamide-phosphate guanylyltransferase